MKLTFWRYDLALTHSWAIATDLRGSSLAGKLNCPVVFVELEDAAGRCGVGEASPSSQYAESWETVCRFLGRIEVNQLSFDDLSSSMNYLTSLPEISKPALCAVNIALLDGASQALRKPLFEFLGLGFPKSGRETSFTIGLDTPEMIERKVFEARDFGVLKLKLGSTMDRENLEALRRVSPWVRVRVDANGAWKTKEKALEQIEWLAAAGQIEFVEQPMPASAPLVDQAWLKERSPLTLVADESYQGLTDAERCAVGYHGVNVKLVKTGGITEGKLALEAARALGLKTQLGCMIESSVLITAAAHLAELADWLDLDGNILIGNDPYRGVVTDRTGMLRFDSTNLARGLGVEKVL
ncbi:MAG: dipeptide epimerase [Pedosphaera sp.]|nr:dipeptide epimerase [Pedosphaera sp.]